MTSVTLEIPVDVVGDLKKLAPLLGCSNYQALLKVYIGDGLKRDLENITISKKRAD